MPTLKTLLNRTGSLVSPRKLVVTPDEAAAEATGPESTVDATAQPRPRLSSIRRPSWLRWPLLDRTTVTLSIEGSSLRIVSLLNQRAVGWASISLDNRLIKNGQIADPVDLGQVIDETFERLSLPRQRVAWALSGFQASARVLDLPGLRGNDLRQAVAEEIDRSLGAAADESYLSWQRLEGRIRSRGVFVLAVPKSTVLTALEALESAEIRPYTMDLRPLALTRAIGRANAVVANLEEGSLDVAIVAGGVPTLLRSVPLPGAATNLEVAQNRLVDEIDRAISYHDDANPERPLDPEAALYLTGRLATGIALAEKIRAVTGHPIGRLATGITSPADFPVGEYLVNLGLALKHS